MVSAVQHHDADAVRQRLKATFDAVNREDAAATRAVAAGVTRRIDRCFVTDPAGVLWADYPKAPESIGKNFADRDWYRGVSRDWQPYISEVYRRNAEPQVLIIAMAAPVRDPAGQVVGIIVFQMPLAYLSEVLKPVHVGGRGYVYVVDGRGNIVAHPKLTDLATHGYSEPADSAPVREALAGRSSASEYRDPITGEAMVAAFHAIDVANGTWVTVAQQPARDVYGPIRRLGLSIAIAGMMTAFVAFLLVGTLRKASLRDRRQSVELESKGQRLEKLATELEQTAAAEHSARVEAQAAHDLLRQAQSRLVQTEKLAALGQLVAGVAHEINNPLAFVLNNVAVLQRDVASIATLIGLYQSGDEVLVERNPDLMRRIRDLAERIDLPYTMTELAEAPVRSREGLARIQQIVKDLRDFARQNALGDIQADADINSGIESTLNIARGMAKKHGIELVSDLAPLPGVTCSPGKINQVVLNLISNAVQASPPGERVLVRTLEVDGGVSIEVLDHGTGIDPAIRGRIFDPFFTTKPQGEGTGLGLSISHGIVSDHGGRIDVESTPGSGTTFRIFLPRSTRTQPKSPSRDAATIA
jgi:signal transduction histidine kinase